DRERDRDRDRERDRYRERSREPRNQGYNKSEPRLFEIDRRGHRNEDRHHNETNRNSRYNRFEDNNRNTAFDRMLAERLSPFRGEAIPLEERIRHLRNWDAPPEG